ncbi:hypothetical protein [Psychromonas aquatilis]|uniref:Uncharacterized protein n=1 Tax=Psychromonas aquatilis TaxID=2005072 RepID=A0ABU9GTA6_9GAMM
MFKLLLVLLFLAIGFACGVGVGAIYELKPAKGTLTTSELTSLIFTILGGAGGIIATAIALYAWDQWKSQHRKAQHYEAKINALRLLNIIELQAINMIVMQANPSHERFSITRSELIDTLGKLNLEVMLIKNFSVHLSAEEQLDMDKLRLLPEISADILNLKLWPKEIDTVDYLSISSFTNWRYENSKSWFYSLPHVPKGVGLKEIKVSVINEGIKSILKDSTKQLVNSL